MCTHLKYLDLGRMLKYTVILFWTQKILIPLLLNSVKLLKQILKKLIRRCFQKQSPEVFWRIATVNNFSKFLGKLLRNIFTSKKGLQQWVFPRNLVILMNIILVQPSMHNVLYQLPSYMKKKTEIIERLLVTFASLFPDKKFVNFHHLGIII